MENAQKQIAAFFQSQDQSKVMVTYSGNTAEGGREAKDYVKSLNENVQELGHTIEVHICAKKYMNEDITKPGNTMLRLMFAVRMGLVGLKFYNRDNTGAVNKDEPLTERMFLIESFFNENYEAGTVAVVRFQVKETVPEDDTINPDVIWGLYRQFDFEEYSEKDGDVPNVSGTPTSESTYIAS